jgi:hypothetical protein
VNTEPNPVTNAGVFVPGMKKFTSTMLLSTAVKMRCGEKVVKSCG